MAAAYTDGFWWSNDSLRLHYRDYAGPDDAARPPIICIPGLTRNARDFEALAQRLAGDWRVILVDLRGRGESAYAKDPMSYVPLVYLQDIEALLREAKIDRFVGFGTSLGGLILMLLAATDKSRLAGVLLNDVGPELDPRGLGRIRSYVGQGRSYETWMHAARALAETQGDAHPDFTITDWLATAKKLMTLTSNGRIAFDYDMKIAEPLAVPAGGDVAIDMWPAFGQFAEIPALIVRGGLSDVLPESAAQRMAAVLRKGELVTLPRVGHAPTLEEPEVEAAIDRMLSRVAADG